MNTKLFLTVAAGAIMVTSEPVMAHKNTGMIVVTAQVLPTCILDTSAAPPVLYDSLKRNSGSGSDISVEYEFTLQCTRGSPLTKVSVVSIPESGVTVTVAGGSCHSPHELIYSDFSGPIKDYICVTFPKGQALQVGTYGTSISLSLSTSGL